MVVCKSKCCNAKVRVSGVPDFIGSKKICTVSYICLKCGKPCDVKKIVMTKAKTLFGEKGETLVTKKQIKKQEKRLDFQDKILEKLVEFLDGITIHPVKGVILTAKKKRQLVELREMEQKLFKSKIKKPRE